MFALLDKAFRLGTCDILITAKVKSPDLTLLAKLLHLGSADANTTGSVVELIIAIDANEPPTPPDSCYCSFRAKFPADRSARAPYVD